MTSVIRPSTPDDLLQLKLLGISAFGATADAPFLDEATMRWKYWEPRGDYSEPRSFVLVNGGRIVAHAGVWPVSFGARRCAHVIDWMAAPDVPGAGVDIHQAVSSRFDCLYSIGGANASITDEYLPALGFQPRGYAATWARPLRPVQQALIHQQRNWKLAPRLVRNALWSVMPGRSIGPEWNVTEVSTVMVPYRDAAFFDYVRLCPCAQVQTFALRRGPDTFGTLMLSTAKRQARIAGIWLDEQSTEHWLAALVLAQDAARRLTDACEIIYRSGSDAARSVIAQAGLRFLHDEAIHSLSPDGHAPDASLNFQLADNDQFFLTSGGRAKFLT